MDKNIVSNMFDAYDNYNKFRVREVFAFMLFVLAMSTPNNFFSSVMVNGSQYAALVNSGITLGIGLVAIILSFVYGFKANKAYRQYRYLVEL